MLCVELIQDVEVCKKSEFGLGERGGWERREEGDRVVEDRKVAVVHMREGELCLVWFQCTSGVIQTLWRLKGSSIHWGGD